MALDNYSNLKAAIQVWSHREDINIVVDDCIDLCETDMYLTGDEVIRVREMQLRSTEEVPTSDRFLALPSKYLAMRRMTITANGRETNISAKDPGSMTIDPTAGQPRFFTISSQIAFDRVGDDNYPLEMNYFAELERLSTTTPTNAILARFPNVYFFGSIAAAFLFAGEEDKATLWSNKFTAVIRRANKQDKQGTYGPGQSVRNVGSTP